MGCAGSKVQSEEGVSRCRKRKRVVKQALRWRGQYSAAHSDYMICLKNLSAAFKHFTAGEFREQLSSSSSAASSSSASSTPLPPATPTTPHRDFPDVVISSIKIPPKHLRSNPPQPITVVVSPPKSPRRSSVFSREDEADEYERYMAADAPPEGLYDDIMQPSRPRGTPVSPAVPPASSGWFSFWGGGGGGGNASTSPPRNYTSGSSSGGGGREWFENAAESESSWDIFGIFQVPQMMYSGHQFNEGVIEEEDEEEMKREMEDEDVPALETASPNREKDYQTRHVQVDEEDDSDHEKNRKKKKKVDDEPVLVHAHEEMVHARPDEVKHKHEEHIHEEPKHEEQQQQHKHEEPPQHKHEQLHKHKEHKHEQEMRYADEEERRYEPPPMKLKGVIIEEIEEDDEVPLRRKNVASSSGMKKQHAAAAPAVEEFRFEEFKDSKPAEPQFSPRAAEPSFSPRAADPPPVKGLEIWEVLHIIYEQFESVSTFGSDVGRLLEPRKPHRGYSLGLSGRSARIFRVVSRSPRTPLSGSLSEDSSSDDLGGSAKFTPEGHATTLDKLYAWEKKLYMEVKDNESIRAEFYRKCKHLKKLDARGASSEAIDKTRVAIKLLETRMQVSMQAMKATSRNIQELTDKDLFHQLRELLLASTAMWENMYACHHKQKVATEKIKVGGNPPLEATSNSHKLATQQLEAALNEWHRSLDKLVKRQREYLRNLNIWLRLSIYTPDRKTEVRIRPPVHNVCQAWATALEKVSEQKLLDGIKSFAVEVHNIVGLQEAEERTRRKAETLAKELNKKALSLNNAEKKLVADGSGSEEAKTSLEERKAGLEVFRKRVEDERESFTRAIQITRKRTAAILETELPKLFSCLEEFSSSCLAGYRELNHKARNNEFDTD